MANTALATQERNRERQNGRQGGDEAAAVPMVPFVQASRERLELAIDNTHTAFGVSVSQQEIPALGFLRYLTIHVVVSGGTAGLATVAADEDAPFNVLQNLQVSDVNGNPIFGPMDGHKAFLVDKYGGYTFASDARDRHSYTDVDTDGDFEFVIRVPLEVSGRDALGSLANMNASQTYKVSYQIASSGTVYSTEPDTLPNSIRVRIYSEAWAQPRGANEAGAQNATLPPAHGTTQYWSLSSYTVVNGENIIRLARVGGLVRMLLLILETSGGARSYANFPDNVRLEYDGSLIENVPKLLVRDRVYDRYGYNGAAEAANGFDTGVFPWSWAHDLDGKPGWENRMLYLQTTQATRLEIRGSFGAAGTLYVLTNDLFVPQAGVA